MATVDVRELRESLSSVLAQVAAGETFLVTDQERWVAQLGPVTPEQRINASKKLTETGFAQWDGEKPRLPTVPGVADLKISDLVIQEREESVLRLLIGTLAKPKPSRG